MLSQHPELQDCIINADKLLAMHHDILAVQSFFFDNVQEKIFRIGTIKGEWNSEMGTNASGVNKINKFDVVTYVVDDFSQYFLAYADFIPTGTLPTDNTYYLQISIKGSDGDPGTGLAPRGNWLNNVQYFVADLVSHKGFLWYTLTENIGNEPTDDSEFWIKINIPFQVSVTTDTPQNLESDGLWLHIQSDGHVIMKTPNTDGGYSVIYPETKAKYVFDATGASLQKKLFQTYLDRDDVIVTMTESENVYTIEAKLLNNQTVIVAREVITDNFEENNSMTDELTIYDETGIAVIYHVINTTELDESGLIYTNTPNVLEV